MKMKNNSFIIYGQTAIYLHQLDGPHPRSQTFKNPRPLSLNGVKQNKQISAKPRILQLLISKRSIYTVDWITKRYPLWAEILPKHIPSRSTKYKKDIPFKSTEGWLSATSSNTLAKHTLHNYYFKALNKKRSCYGLNVWCPSKFLRGSPNPQCGGTWRSGFWRVIRVGVSHERGTLTMGLTLLQEKEPCPPCQEIAKRATSC